MLSHEDAGMLYRRYFLKALTIGGGVGLFLPGKGTQAMAAIPGAR